MDLWITERHEDVRAVSYKVSKTLFHGVSPFQTVDIVETEALGRMLLLDGLMMTTERDEFIYHELISHIPLLAHPNPKNVLVIGGGDGGVVREVLKHPSVERVVLCEIDGMVIDACREFLPSIAAQLGDPRVEICVEDGVAFMARYENAFDVIIIDSTDPLGPGVGLFTEPFYKNVHKALTENGIMTAQTESPTAVADGVRKIFDLLHPIFPVTQAYYGYVPTYPGGYWCWAFCSKGIQPLVDVPSERLTPISNSCQFFNDGVRHGVFALPNFIRPLVSARSPLSC